MTLVTVPSPRSVATVSPHRLTSLQCETTLDDYLVVASFLPRDSQQQFVARHVMKLENAKLKKLAKLIRSLEDELSVLESSHHIQFETAASLRDKLVASKRAKSALANARRLCDAISQSLSAQDD